MIKFKLFQNTPENWMLKLVSLMLAIMLWYFVVGEDQVDINIRVPIEIINLPAELTVSNQFKKDIEVAVRGPRSLMLDLRNKNITRPVDLTGAQPGTIVIQNDEKSIPFPKGVTVQRLQPTNITLLLDELLQKRFSIVPVTEGEPAPGYVLQQIYIAPDNLTISGPRSILEKETKLKTYVINLDDLDRSTTLQVHLNLEPDLFDLIGETVVTAKIEVGEKMIEQVVEKIPVNVRDAATPVTVEPNTVTVRARIPEKLLKDTPEPAMLFRASISSNNITTAREMDIKVNGVNVPGHEPISILSVTPRTITVRPVDSPDQKP